MNERRYDIDWLRNLGILLLFPFHTARVFDIFEPNYVKNAVWHPGISLFANFTGLSDACSLFLFFTGYWFMPLLFWLAGSSSWYALQKRDAGQYRRERVLRLLVPLLFGLIVIVPPQAYIARLMQGWSGSYFSFLGSYFTNFSDLSGYYGTFTPAHLWFILYLFIISMAMLPLMTAIRRRVMEAAEGGRAFRFAGWLGRPAAFLLIPVALTLTEALPDFGGKNLFFYCALFMLGYLAVAAEPMRKAIARLRLGALIALPVCLALFYLMAFQWGFGAYPDISLPQAILALVRNGTMLLTLIVMLGYGEKIMNRNAKALPYMNRAAFPVYILHQTVLVAVAFFAVRWNLPLWGRYAAILALSIILTVGIYELLVRRFSPLRFLFGIKAGKRP